MFPDKLNANAGIDNYRVLLTPAIGTCPELNDRVTNRVAQVIAQHGIPTDQLCITIVGHGTRRNSTSGKSTYALADSILTSTKIGDAKVQVAFLDQDPEIEQVAEQLDAPINLIIPFLISRGPHTTIDLPTALGMPADPEVQFPVVSRKGNQVFWLDTPVGMYPEMSDICTRLAVDRLLHLKMNNEEAA